ncbi:probable E3 ubiquitin-protein ligase WAVH2 [Argentina anserina]|uniref:probable E3 ubiquitin-protein ligase WAVH2 n=1 Tax=Argentina anserina TaxID=57926 RepID=UPI002176717C|nr:probable E3 ubiquitin-protein ligase WAVH2 [Potentilla anserina]
MSIYNDDEPIRKQNSTEEEASLELDGNTEARIINKQEAPLEESPFKVLLELKGVGSGEGRLGVDLVTILDVSGSMQGTKIAKMQLAMQFLVQKLGRTDRLSVVTFNRKADRRCPLRQMTEDSRTNITNDVNGLVARGSTNTEAGLKMAMKILNERTRSKRRRAAIMLMSDGIEDDESDAANVSVGDVPVYTFGFGSDCDGEVLRAIAKNGGTYADVVELDKLNVAFSMSLAGLLNVAIEDLDLTITLDKGAKFTAVNAGNYQQNKGSKDVEPVTVKFGSLYDREIRKVLVDLTLPEVKNRLGANYFTISYRYRVGGKDTYKTNKIISNVTRVAGSSEAEREEVLAEEKRIGTASSMKEARLLADAKKLEEARKKLQDAKTKLSVKEVDAILRAQLDQLLVFMVSQETYDKQGRAFALAVEASHDSQRAQPLPNADPSKVGMFTTPLMDLFMQQAMLFDQNPTGYRVPTEEEDKKVILNKLEMAVKFMNDMANKIKGMAMPGIGMFTGKPAQGKP